MKISFMTFACPEYSLDQVLAAAVQYGYHGVEFRTDANHSHGVEISSSAAERKAFRAKLEDLNVEACCLATSLQFATDRVMDEVQARVDLAYDIGCPALRVFCGPAPEGFNEKDTIERCGSQLRAAAELSTDADVQLWLETHDTFCKAAPAAAAVRFADHRNVGINWDNMHPYRLGETLPETVGALGNLVRHTHWHDAVNARDKVIITPLDKGELPMDEMMQALAKMGYNAYLSGEWFNTMYGETPEESLSTFYEDMQTLCKRNGVTLAAR